MRIYITKEQAHRVVDMASTTMVKGTAHHKIDTFTGDFYLTNTNGQLRVVCGLTVVSYLYNDATDNVLEYVGGTL